MCLTLNHNNNAMIQLESSSQKTESHVIILFLLFFLHLGGGGSWSSLSGGGRSSSGELTRISQELLQHLRLLEGDISDGGDGQEVLHAVGNAVWSGRDCWISNLQTDSGNIGNSSHKFVLDVIIGDVKDLWAEHGALVVDFLDNQTVGEGGDLQHVEKGGLGSPDLVTNLDDGHILDDFNCTLGNLGWDLESLEEGSLLGTHAGVLCRDGDINRSNGTSLGGSLLLVGQKKISNNGELLLGEDESNVHLDVRQQLLELWVLLDLSSDDLPHHGVLAHEDDSLASEGNPDLLHLLGSDIVSSNDEALGILFQELGEPCEVVCFPG